MRTPSNTHEARQPSVLTALSLALALALSACASGPDYAKPESTMPPAFAHAAPAGASTAPALETWWTHFNDPVLTRIVERVLAQNLDLEASMARVDQARATARVSKAALLPTLSANAQIATQHQSLESPLGKLASHQPGYSRDGTDTSAAFSASWELDLAGGLQRGNEASVAEAQAATAAHLGVRVSVAAEAADAYFRVRGAQARLALASDEIRTDTDLLGLVQLRLKEGLSNQRELAQAEARVAHIQASLAPLRSERDIQLNRLDVLMGAQPGTYATELAASTTVTSIPALALTLHPEELLRRRPDVLAAESRLVAANARIGVATAAYYPTFSLSALLGFESLNSGEPSDANFQPQALLGLRWRLFDFGRIDAEVAHAKGARAEALATYRLSMLRATEEVENALLQQTELDAERRALQSEVEASVRARDSSQEAYKGGVTSLMEVLEQDRQLLAARDQLALAHTNSGRAVVATFRAVGGGW